MRLILFVACVGLVFVTSCSPYRNKIEAVLIAHARAQAKLIRTPKNKSELTNIAKGNSDALLISPTRYVSALQKIDISKCPADFKIAWGNYIAAWTDNDAKAGELFDVTAIIASAAEAGSSSSTNSQDMNYETRFAAWLDLKKHIHGAPLIGDDF